MTKSNVELARDLNDAWNRSDWEAVEAVYWPDAEAIAPSSEAIDDQRVLQSGRWRGAGKESGIPLDLEIWFISDFRYGKVAKIVYFTDRDEAMRAAGR